MKKNRDLEALRLFSAACEMSSHRMIAANIRWAWDRYVLGRNRKLASIRAEKRGKKS